jgi:hypothetical protein
VVASLDFCLVTKLFYALLAGNRWLEVYQGRDIYPSLSHNEMVVTSETRRVDFPCNGTISKKRLYCTVPVLFWSLILIKKKSYFPRYDSISQEFCLAIQMHMQHRLVITSSSASSSGEESESVEFKKAPRRVASQVFGSESEDNIPRDSIFYGVVSIIIICLPVFNSLFDHTYFQCYTRP